MELNKIQFYKENLGVTFIQELCLKKFNLIPSMISVNKRLKFEKINEILIGNGFSLISSTTWKSRTPNEIPKNSFEMEDDEEEDLRDRSVSIYINNSLKSIVYVDDEGNEYNIKIFYDINIPVLNDLIECEDDEKEKVKTGFISIIAKSKYGSGGLTTNRIPFPKCDINIEKNYNDDFIPVYNDLVAKLKTEISGLHLFHGEPGCGKTSLIKHLIQTINRKIIYCPPMFMDMVVEPDFITFLLDNPNAIFILEDAERVLKSRKEGGTMAISNLLNLSDGLLGDISKIQIIATFNCDVSELDEALMRKGRMLTKYEFKKLSVDKANSILEGKHITDHPLSLAEIYHFDEAEYKNKESILGI